MYIQPMSRQPGCKKLRTFRPHQGRTGLRAHWPQWLGHMQLPLTEATQASPSSEEHDRKTERPTVCNTRVFIGRSPQLWCLLFFQEVTEEHGDELSSRTGAKLTQVGEAVTRWCDTQPGLPTGPRIRIRIVRDRLHPTTPVLQPPGRLPNLL
mmetsp:Transcript_71939/g.156726  ORF Transcript_71939/g.156726 Transcript_71939/m.156726 type:complete len:152 (-) Transcript_71939:322-777(-)